MLTTPSRCAGDPKLRPLMTYLTGDGVDANSAAAQNRRFHARLSASPTKHGAYQGLLISHTLGSAYAHKRLVTTSERNSSDGAWQI